MLIACSKIKNLMGMCQRKIIVYSALAIFLIALPVDAQDSSKRYGFHIAGGGLEDVLENVRDLTGVSFIYSFELVDVDGLNPINGQYTIAEALEIMLRDTGLSGGLTENGMIVVTQIKNAKALNREETEVQNQTKRSLLASAALILLGGQHNVAAQEEKPKALEDNSRILEVVTVTAEKREESVLDIPIALTAYSGDDLANAGVFSVDDLQKISPSFQFGQDGGVNIIGMRGVSAGLGVIGAEGAVTVSQNGVTLGRLTLWDSDLFDVERVEVLRGPQGVINGRNATGGAINIYSKLPSDKMEAGIKSTIGNYNKFSNEAYVSGPLLNSNVRGRFAFSTDQANGWLHNVQLNERLNNKNKTQARASFVADVTNNIEAVLILDAIRDHSNRNTGFDRGRVHPDQPGLAELLGVSSGNIDDLEVEVDQLHVFEKEQFGATLRLTADLSPNATLTSTTGYVDQDIHQTYDCDGTVSSFCAFPSTPVFEDGYGFQVSQVSQELTLAADLTDKLDIILGGLYLDDDAEHLNHFTAAGAGLVADGVQLRTAAKLTSYAAYTQLRYQLNDNIRLAAGVRYTKDEKEYSEDGIVFFPGSYSAENSWDAVTPRFAIDIQPNENLTLYASASRGFRSGGYSISFLGPEDEFDPEFVWNYEAGVKANLFENRALFSLSAFTMDYKNIQQIVFGLDGPGTDTINAAKADITGMEFEFKGWLTENFKVDFSGTWLDTGFAEFRTADPIFTELGEFNSVTGLNVRDLSGNQLPRSPEFKYVIGAEYRTEFGAEIEGFLRANYTWQDDIHFSPYNYDLSLQEAYGLLGLSAGIESTEGDWSLTAFARNVSDERYFQVVNVTGASFLNPTSSQLGLLGTPRQYGVTFSYNF